MSKSKKATQPVVIVSTSVPERFRPGTKRHACFMLLMLPKGATLLEGSQFTNWPERVVLSEFHEIAKLVDRCVVRTEDVYQLAERSAK